MKKFLLLLAISAILSSASVQQANASHGMGGEITWRCLSTGKFVFQLKFYRDCNGIAAPGGISLTTTVPGVPTINMIHGTVTDISHQGFFSDGTTPCPTCFSAGGPPGIVEEHIYESNPITLNGTPPTQGWQFYWGDCCRSNALTNITNPGSVGFRLVATMYPYMGNNMNPCYDSSPFFIERPNIMTCSNLPVYYNHLAADAEFDSLAYSFTTPLDDSGNLVTFAGGFSVNNPLPGTNTLDSHTGEFSTVSSIGGYFVTAIKVRSYKCGILVSENVREVNVVLQNNCPVVNGVINTAPAVNAPFQDPVTGLYTSYADTVFAGDTVNFNLNFFDFENFDNGIYQNITFNSYGLQYGDSYTNANSGCLIPPCATLGVSPPIQTQFGGMVTFNWTTTPAHLGYSFSCVSFSNTYYFITKTQDNYCPANAVEERVFSITVIPTIPRPPVVNNGGTLECPWGAGYTYQWFYNRFAIPGATGSSYTPSQPGDYRLLAVAPDGQGNYSDNYVYNPLGIYDNNQLQYISIIPNPSSDGLFELSMIVTNDIHFSIMVSDVFGRTIMKDTYLGTTGNNTFRLNLSERSGGVYFIELSNGKGVSKKVRVLKI